MADLLIHTGRFNADTGLPIMERWHDNGDGTYSPYIYLGAESITLGKVAIDQTTPGTTNAVVATGNVASGATDSGNPQKVGGKYNATPPTFTDGQRGDLQVDSAGNLKVTQATQIEGESATYHRMMTIVACTPFAISTATTTTVKTGAGYLDEMIVEGGTLGNVTVYDNTAASGTVLLPAVTPAQGQVVLRHISFATGLTITTASATIIAGGYL